MILLHLQVAASDDDTSEESAPDVDWQDVSAAPASTTAGAAGTDGIAQPAAQPAALDGQACSAEVTAQMRRLPPQVQMSQSRICQ